jgi:hypothetical protein
MTTFTGFYYLVNENNLLKTPVTSGLLVLLMPLEGNLKGYFSLDRSELSCYGGNQV